MRQRRGPNVGEGRFEPERLEVVEEQLGVLGALVRRPAPHGPIAERREDRPNLAIQPAALDRPRRISAADPVQERRASQVGAGSDPRLAYAGPRERVERRVELDEPLERPDPVVEPAVLAVVGRRVAQPVELAVLVPVLVADVVVDDPAFLGGWPGEPDLGRHPEASHVAPLGLVPG